MDLQSMSYEMLMFLYITNKEAFDKARINIKAIEEEMKRRKSVLMDKNRAGKLEYELSPEMRKVLEVEEVPREPEQTFDLGI